MQLLVPFTLLWILLNLESIVSNIVRTLRFIRILPRPTYSRCEAVELLRANGIELYDVNLAVYDYPLVYIIVDQTKWTRDHGRRYRVHAFTGERV